MTSTHQPSGLGAQDLDSLRATLLRVRAENVADVEKARATLNTLLEDGTAGEPSLREDTANAEYMIDDATSIIAQVDAALKRIEDGTYGICTRCGNPIPLARLGLRPYGPTCVACAS
jgi:RNA polymerase-binding transcription factor DksA